MKKTFRLPVTWEVCGWINVEAESLEDAVKDFKENSEDYELPTDDCEYVESSFKLSEDNIEILKLINE